MNYSHAYLRRALDKKLAIKRIAESCFDDCGRAASSEFVLLEKFECLHNYMEPKQTVPRNSCSNALYY